jgi:3-oxoacyl-[acyl-carrier protein] reductase
VRVAIDDDGYDEAWARGLAVMLTAHQRTIRAALPYLRQSKSPRIVSIASTEALGATALHSPVFGGQGRRGRPDAFARGGTRPRRHHRELYLSGADHDRHDGADQRRAQGGLCPTPHRAGRYGDPEEVAHMTLSLCLPAASFLTGAIIPVDGGSMARNA